MDDMDGLRQLRGRKYNSVIILMIGGSAVRCVSTPLNNKSGAFGKCLRSIAHVRKTKKLVFSLVLGMIESDDVVS